MTTTPYRPNVRLHDHEAAIADFPLRPHRTWLQKQETRLFIVTILGVLGLAAWLCR